jgi:hypothetical protein
MYTTRSRAKKEERASSPAATQVVPSTLQRKLTVGTVDDPFEREADATADRVMRMPEPSLVQRKCAECEEEEEQVQRKSLATEVTPFIRAKGEEGGVASDAVAARIDSSRGTGSPLPEETRSFMENRFGADFSAVRLHTDSDAAQLSKELNAHAFTVGNDVFFNSGKYSPESSDGKQVLAHELTHTLQQSSGIRRNTIQRYAGCTTTQDGVVTADHALARQMLSNAIAAVSSYNGTSPAKVFNALSKHFNGATSNAFATWINVNLRFLWGTTWMAGYDCYASGIIESTWACGANALATTFWCVPGVNIRLCPSYFNQSATERATTLIHEWVHKYGCNFDLGYEHESDYSGNWTLTQLLNADSFSSFIRDVQ